MTANAVAAYCDQILEVLWDAPRAQVLFEQAAATVDSVANGNFDRDHIRTQPFTEGLQQACAVGALL